jgi:hypothetical protein
VSSIASNKYAGRFAVAAGAFVLFVRLARVLPGAVWEWLTEPVR